MTGRGGKNKVRERATTREKLKMDKNEQKLTKLNQQNRAGIQ